MVVKTEPQSPGRMSEVKEEPQTPKLNAFDLVMNADQTPVSQKKKAAKAGRKPSKEKDGGVLFGVSCTFEGRMCQGMKSFSKRDCVDSRSQM